MFAAGVAACRLASLFANLLRGLVTASAFAALKLDMWILALGVFGVSVIMSILTSGFLCNNKIISHFAIYRCDFVKDEMQKDIS